MSILADFGAGNLVSPHTDLPIELIYALRVLLGSVLGLLLGIERSRRQKEAGMATHFVVGCASTLLTCISLWFNEKAGIADGARIAAQVVSGVGFLGAGMIFFRRESLRGLTTAAGIWATAAIGMCSACGMYYLAVGATLFIILIQILLHAKFVRRNNLHLLLIKMEYTDDIKNKLTEYFGVDSFHRFKITSTNEKFLPDAQGHRTISDPQTEEQQPDPIVVSKKLTVETVIYPTQNVSAEAIAKFIRENPQIHSIERLEDL